MSELKSILLVQDNRLDAELFMEALTEHKLANRITLVKDGVDAMAYLRCEDKSPSGVEGAHQNMGVVASVQVRSTEEISQMGPWRVSRRRHDVSLHDVPCDCSASRKWPSPRHWKDIYLIAYSPCK